jgi:hypothetical protein
MGDKTLEKIQLRYEETKSIERALQKIMSHNSAQLLRIEHELEDYLIYQASGEDFCVTEEMERFTVDDWNSGKPLKVGDYVSVETATFNDGVRLHGFGDTDFPLDMILRALDAERSEREALKAAQNAKLEAMLLEAIGAQDESVQGE